MAKNPIRPTNESGRQRTNERMQHSTQCSIEYSPGKGIRQRKAMVIARVSLALSRQCLAAQCDAVHLAAVTLIIIHRIVPAGAIIPDGDRARFPLQSALIVFR